MFGFSFGELCVLLLVAMVVLGPKELPRYLRKAGQFAGRIRRLAYEMREKSGIDEVLRTEGIDREIAEIRSLARGEIVGVASAVRSITNAARIGDTSRATNGAITQPQTKAPEVTPQPVVVVHEREYPHEGADSYGALPDTAAVYDGSFAASPLAEDALYARGDSTAPAVAPAPANPAATPAGTTV